MHMRIYICVYILKCSSFDPLAWTPGRFWGVGFDPHVGNHFKGQQPKINQNCPESQVMLGISGTNTRVTRPFAPHLS